MGFGLNISKRLIHKLGGEISLANNELDRIQKKGVTATIKLPFKAFNLPSIILLPEP